MFFMPFAMNCLKNTPLIKQGFNSDAFFKLHACLCLLGCLGECLLLLVVVFGFGNLCDVSEPVRDGKRTVVAIVRAGHSIPKSQEEKCCSGCSFEHSVATENCSLRKQKSTSPGRADKRGMGANQNELWNRDSMDPSRQILEPRMHFG